MTRVTIRLACCQNSAPLSRLTWDLGCDRNILAASLMPVAVPEIRNTLVQDLFDPAAYSISALSFTTHLGDWIAKGKRIL